MEIHRGRLFLGLRAHAHEEFLSDRCPINLCAKLKLCKQKRNRIAVLCVRHSPMCSCTSKVWLFEPSRNDGKQTSAFKLFVGDALEAEAGQSLVFVHR